MAYTGTDAPTGSFIALHGDYRIHQQEPGMGIHPTVEFLHADHHRDDRASEVQAYLV